MPDQQNVSDPTAHGKILAPRDPSHEGIVNLHSGREAPDTWACRTMADRFGPRSEMPVSQPLSGNIAVSPLPSTSPTWLSNRQVAFANASSLLGFRRMSAAQDEQGGGRSG